MDLFVEFTINLLTLWFWMWCCDELSLSGLDIVSPFNEIPESMGPSIDCGRELDPSTCNTKNKQTNWATCFLNHYDIIWCPVFQSKFSRQSCCTDKLFKLDMVIGPLIVFFCISIMSFRKICFLHYIIVLRIYLYLISISSDEW